MRYRKAATDRFPWAHSLALACGVMLGLPCAAHGGSICGCGVSVPVTYLSRVPARSHPAALSWREGLGGIALALLLVLTMAVTAAWAQLGLVRRDGFFTITWNVDRSDPQRVAIVGSVSHDQERATSRVRLRVDGVNASGQLVSRAVGSVDQEIPPAGESFFEIRLTPFGTEVTFQVSVISFQFEERMSEAP